MGKRLLADPMQQAREQGQQYEAAAESAPNAKQKAALLDTGGALKMSSFVPLVGPLAGQLAKRFQGDPASPTASEQNPYGTEGDPSGALTEGVGLSLIPKVLKSAIRGSQAAIDAIPNAERAGQAFQEVSKVAGSHTVPVTDGLSNSLMKYQQLVDSGGSRSLAVSKLLNRLTDPEKGPLTYDEARLFQSNISRLSADEFNRLHRSCRGRLDRSHMN